MEKLYAAIVADLKKYETKEGAEYSSKYDMRKLNNNQAFLVTEKEIKLIEAN